MAIWLQRLARLAFVGVVIFITVMVYLVLKEYFVIENRWLYMAVEVFGLIFTLYVLLTAVVVFFENKNPSKTISWLLVLFLLPGVGFVFYMLFGKDFRKRWRLKKKEPTHYKVFHTAGLQKKIFEHIELFDDGDSLVSKRLINLLLSNSDTPVSINNRVKVLTNGEETYEAMLGKIQDAYHHIHLEMFIIRNDGIGKRFKDVLIQKAKEGVKVRVIYDSVGCWRLGSKYIKELQAAGIEAYPFFPVVFPVIRRELNYRNHRKILIVDGQWGFVGGLNIGDEYLGMDPRLGFWRDTHLMLEGESVYSLQSLFSLDWIFVGGEAYDGDVYYPQFGRLEEQMVQIAASGPDSDWGAILQAYFTMIATAEKRIWIATPYLVPEESILMGLKTAALSGVDVRIIIPSKADHYLVYWASRDHIEDLLKAGVKIYTYEKGFIHSKMLMVDGIGASIGTANLDIRSLEINFEVNAFIYDKMVVSELEKNFFMDLKDSKEILLEEHLKRGIKQRFLESLGRIVSPLQ